MELGYRLFETLHDGKHLYEVFPLASYVMLKGIHHPHVSLSFAKFTDGPKDMLDACVAAFTVHSFIHGQGVEVGSGDGLGTIILPGQVPVPDSHPELICIV